jgi:hypothetical protein
MPTQGIELPCMLKVYTHRSLQGKNKDGKSERLCIIVDCFCLTLGDGLEAGLEGGGRRTWV